MKIEDIDLNFVPESNSFVDKMTEEFCRWEAYSPKEIKDDIPFDEAWWKYLYWIPKIKKEFYHVALFGMNYTKGLNDIYEKYGISEWYFETHYKGFLKRLLWMRKHNNANHVGEVTKGV